MTDSVQQLADVIAFPARRLASQASDNAMASLHTARAWVVADVDDWGRDNGLVNRVWSMSQLRWNTSVGGTTHLPKRRGALIVINARRWSLAPVFASLAIGASIDRPVRFVGRPDVAPLGPMMQRLGALLPVEAELTGALRADELVVLGADHLPNNRACGTIDHRLVGAALDAGVKVIPAGAASVPLRRSARVEIGAAARLRQTRRGPLEAFELAQVAQRRIDGLLNEMGGTLSGTPLDWLAAGGIGAL